MTNILNSVPVPSWITPVARIGLAAKGLVYCLIGILAFMAAFDLGGQNSDDADRQGVLKFIQGTGGNVFLGIIAAGLLCYSLWRVVEGVADARNKGASAKGIATRIRYVVIGLIYLSVAWVAIKMITGWGSSSGDGNTNEAVVKELLTKPFGQWLAGIFALVFAGIGVYQIIFGLSEKYKKFVNEQKLEREASSMLMKSGKIGFVARGIVWLIVSWLIVKAAMYANSSTAGDSTDAFKFLQEASYGSYLLGAIGFGLLCFGFFNLVRARYESL